MAARGASWGKLFLCFLAVAALTLILPAHIGILWTAAALAACSLLLAWFFSYRRQKSLSAIVHMIEAISRGDFSRRLHAEPGAQESPLVDAANRMAASIGDFVRAQSDQRGQLEAILETMAEGVLVLGPKGRIRRANRTLVEHFPSLACAEGKLALEAIPSPALQDVVATLLADAKGFGRVTAIQIEPRPDKIFSVSLARPNFDGAHAIGVVAVFRDITERIRLETIRRDFVANVSHELRTPLTAIRGYAETLIDMEDAPEQARRFAQIIRKHGISLSAMVDDLLALSRLENNNASIRRETAPGAGIGTSPRKFGGRPHARHARPGRQRAAHAGVSQLDRERLPLCAAGKRH